LNSIIIGNILTECEILNKKGKWENARFENIEKNDCFRASSTEVNCEAEGIATKDTERMNIDNYRLEFITKSTIIK